MASKKNDYGNDSISSLKGADRVRKRPGVIFGSDGLDGCEHAVFEILSNAIDEARETGEPVDLKPMNSFERKIIHDVVREEGMKSRSHGEEPHRYVTVYVKASAADDADEIDEA